MEIQGLMQLDDVELLSVVFNRNEAKRLKAVAQFRAAFSQPIAEAMHIKGIFRADGTLETDDESRALGHRLAYPEFTLPSGDTEGTRVYRPEMLTGFKLACKEGDLSLRWCAHISGDNEAYSLLALRSRMLSKDARFEAAIRSAQGEFDFSGATPQGVEVDMSGEPGEAETSGPLFGGYHATLTNSEGEVLAEFNGKREPAIPDVCDMGHRKPRQQRTRAEMSGPTPEQIQAVAGRDMGDVIQ
jgi:hypothetical protein